METDERLKHLTSKGYFPRELPLAFTTEDFGAYSRDIFVKWRASGIIGRKSIHGKGGATKSGNFLPKTTFAEPDLLTIPKRGHERRDLSVTHPVPQLALNEQICTHWRSIQKWLARQALSNDEIQIGEQFPRSIKGINFDFHRMKKDLIEAESDWVVQTDITRFYPSIYTHSITWAAYGKNKVKAKMPDFKGSLADRIDTLVRACNVNQTGGIPVGPESSRIVAEIISARIDQDFLRQFEHGELERIDRLQDDWFMGFEQLPNAEKALAIISDIYRAYNLEINGSKTSIYRAVRAESKDWLSEMRGFLSHRSGKLTGNRLAEFLNLAIKLQVEQPSAPVANYALSVLENHQTRPLDVQKVESFLLKACTVSPGSFDRISSLLISIQAETGLVSKKRIERRFKELLLRFAKNGHHFEVLWILYTFRGLSICVRENDIAEIFKLIRASTIRLVVMDLRNRGLWKPLAPIDLWASEISKEAIEKTGIWLFAYESFRHEWLPDSGGLMKQNFFKPMADRNIVFYDPNRNVRPRKARVRTRRSARSISVREALGLLDFGGWNFAAY